MTIKNKKILLTGASGFLGQHVYKKLIQAGVDPKNVYAPSSKKIDLRKYEDCVKAVKDRDIVIHLAAKIGGIGFNKEKPGEIFYENSLMGLHLIEAARLAGVKKFVTTGTVCSYPKNAPLPFKEESLWDGYPEEVTAPYGIAKKMLIVQGRAYYEQYGFKSFILMPVNLYGPGDHFESNYSHVMTALIKKIVDAKINNEKSVSIWGTGKANREFIYVEDAARAIVMAVRKYDKLDPINLGSGVEISIAKLVEIIKKTVGYNGKTVWDKTKPDGVLRRKMNTRRAYKEFGFKAKTDLKKGIKKTVDWYIKNRI
ncbi:MAG TPA: GDP-L-fucose synthase [Patescibacteria group bacterium]|nr:GDP-L-fucose synthase [Patescibacteria group bacterium]